MENSWLNLMDLLKNGYNIQNNLSLKEKEIYHKLLLKEVLK